MRPRQARQLGRKVLAVGVAWALAGGAGVIAQPVTEPAGKPETPSVPPPPPDEMGPPPPPDAKQQAEGARKMVAGGVTLADEPEFPVSEFVVEYDRQHPNLPTTAQLLSRAKVTLRREAKGWAAPREGEPGETVTVEALNRQIGEGKPPLFSRRALALVLEAIRSPLREQGIIGVLIESDPEDLVIERSGDQLIWKDLREGERSTLRLRIFAVTVSRVTTAASGNRIRRPAEAEGGTLFYDRLPSEVIYDWFSPPSDGASLIDHPEHERIRAASPVQPLANDDSELRRDLLNQDELDDYTLRLNRHPNRRVDVTVTGAEEPNEVVLMYLVRENNPLMIYFQMSNTGTPQTSIWRARLGFEDTQLTGDDDTLSVDFVTGLGKSNVLNAFYDRPLDDSGLWRGRAFGNFTNFDASEVGQANENFTGQSWFIGGEISRTLWQGREQFLDAFAGIRFEQEQTINQTFDITGKTNFLLPSIGLRYQRATDEMTTTARAHIEGNLPNLAGTSAAEVVKLGRPGTTTKWQSLMFEFEHAFYLEPLLMPEAFARGESTLAHEISISCKGQYAFNNRLVPTFEQVAGGLYTVRGYPESIVSGDTVVVGSLEYRLHIPRLLNPHEEPGTLFGKSFRWAPQQAYGRPDWDLVFRGFLDGAQTYNSQKTTFENNATLVGTGVGMELLYRRNVNIRLDWGYVLRTVPGQAEKGDNRLHFVATFLF